MLSNKLFSDFTEISEDSKSVLSDLGFKYATPVQDATIPLFCGNKDVAVDACTGSGKTLAFIIPIIEKLKNLENKLKINQVGAVIISPTRELARQIFKVAVPFIEKIPGYSGLLLVGGGGEIFEDVKNFQEKGGHVIVGTPGRLEAVMTAPQTDMDLKTVEVLVLDEADRLLDMGFQNQLNSIMNLLPRQRRTGLFSATQTEAVEALIRAGLRNPVRVNVAVTSNQNPTQKLSQKTPDGLKVRYVICDEHEKINQLYIFLSLNSNRKIIVYFLTCASVDYHKTVFSSQQQLQLLKQKKNTQRKKKSNNNNNINSNNKDIRNDSEMIVLPLDLQIYSLHGKMKQTKREKTLSEFEENKSGAVLFCTDVAARGLDIPDVHWIVQFDPPQDPSVFVHRAGRTARMGREGDALVYLLPAEIDYVEFLELKKVPMQEQQKYVFSNKNEQNILNSQQIKYNNQANDNKCEVEQNDGSVQQRNFSNQSKQNIQLINNNIDNSNEDDNNNNNHDCQRFSNNGVNFEEKYQNSEQVLNFEEINPQFLSEQDRGVMDKGKKAFVAFVRGYKEHHCRFIFRLEELDAVNLGQAFGLLQMPKMPEIKRLKNVREFKNSEVDINSIPFKDKAREKQRQRLLKEKQQVDKSQKKEQQIQRRKEDKQQLRDSQVIQAVRQLPKRQRAKLLDREEEKFLQDEYRLLKKLRTKKISEQQFDEATGIIAAQQEQWENKKQKQQEKLLKQQQKQLQEDEDQRQEQEQEEGNEEGEGDVENNNQLQNFQNQTKLGRLKKVQIQRRRAERLASLVTGKFLTRVRKKVARKNKLQQKSEAE